MKTTTGLDQTIGKRAGRPQKTSERGGGGTVFAPMPGPCRDLAPLPGADEHLPRQRCQHRCPEPSCTPVTLPDLQSISARGPGTVFKVGTGHCPSTAPSAPPLGHTWSLRVGLGSGAPLTLRAFIPSFIHSFTIAYCPGPMWTLRVSQRCPGNDPHLPEAPSPTGV